MNPPSFLARVRAQRDAFHPMERRLADFVLEFPGDLASYAASELADLAGVSNATVTRFIRRLGYPGYGAARRAIRREKEAGSPLFIARRGAAEPDASATPRAYLARCQQNLRETLIEADDATIRRIARAVLAARRVRILGFRSSRSFATYLQWQLFQVKEATQVIPGPGDTLAQYLADAGPPDLFIVFGLRRRPASLRRVLDEVLRTGAQLLYVTDAQLAPLEGASWHLRCHTAASAALDNHVAVIAVCHRLASAVLALAGPAERARLSAIEAGHDSLDEL